jgi:hypothetical protein
MAKLDVELRKIAKKKVQAVGSLKDSIFFITLTTSAI